MGRKQERAIKKAFQKDMVLFLKIQHHFFPYLVKELSQIKDPRHQSYTEYDIEEIIYPIVLKNVFNLTSMQDMTHQFNQEERVLNVCEILGKSEKQFLPHYVTINDCLKRLNPDELEKVRTKLVQSLLRKRSFEEARFLGKYWPVIVDATGLFYFKEKHCEHCLKKTVNRGTPEEKTYYYHSVLEAKIVFGENLVISIATEFIENENENVLKQDCERKAFKRLAQKIKASYPRLPICILGDSLYACAPVFQTCEDNKWGYLIRFKDGSIPTLAQEYQTILAMGENECDIRREEKRYPRKPKETIKNEIKWISELRHQAHQLTEISLKTEKDGKGKGIFQWVTNLKVTKKTVWEFAETGRKRWLIENEGFNIQKNHRYTIEHANSLNNTAMKNHYLLTQIADLLLQLYENGISGLRSIKKTIKNISSDLLISFSTQLTREDIYFIRKRTSISIS